MLLVLASDELQGLIQNFSKRKIKVEYLSDNQLKLKFSGMTVSLFLSEVRPKSVSFIYKMNSFVSFLLEKVVAIDRPGITLDKEENKIELDLNQILKGEKAQAFYLKRFLMDDGKIIIDFQLEEKGLG